MQGEIDEAVKVLLVLKAEYKIVTGSDWKPGVTPPTTATPVASSGGEANIINEKIIAQGNAVREMKAAKASKACKAPYTLTITNNARITSNL